MSLIISALVNFTEDECTKSEWEFTQHSRRTTLNSSSIRGSNYLVMHCRSVRFALSRESDHLRGQRDTTRVVSPDSLSTSTEMNECMCNWNKYIFSKHYMTPNVKLLFNTQ